VTTPEFQRAFLVEWARLAGMPPAAALRRAAGDLDELVRFCRRTLRKGLGLGEADAIRAARDPRDLARRLFSLYRLQSGPIAPR